ncbi:dihydrofolate reductase family protein [Arsenicibacter rosenii]|uniref:Deaminase n=1 Tax=Arsenicibacter rosenii TaxID=1750698 RepID=A0A1S2VLY3_9BACT|nr:dihydrofolate reductase family protein [Arsenicibacter rosenii]OIN59763.1 deaminase [Arsenicibacter rosenii]
MRTLKLQVQMTVDGFIGGPNGEMDWMTFAWDQEVVDYVTNLIAPVDTIVLGRKLADGFIPHWAGIAADPESPEKSAGEFFTNTPKVVFSQTPPSPDWANTVVATGDLTDEITALKQQDGGDIIAYGGSSFVASLIKAGLIDAFHLFVNPVAIGQGLPIFNLLDSKQPLTLVKATPFACGIVVLHYKK